MIASLRGELTSVTPICVVTVGGVGFEVQIPEKDRTLLAGRAREVSFHTYLYVREDRLTLFGFLRREDRELFMRLIEVSGIGPRIALGVMMEHSAERIASAVKGSDIPFLCRLPGLGKKTAERLVMELKDKLEFFVEEPTSQAPDIALREEALLALTSLGMPRVAAERALEKVQWEEAEQPQLEFIVKEALKHASSV